MSENCEICLFTGIKVLDEMLGDKGISVGSAILLRGAPGTGKTTMACQIADKHQMIADGKTVQSRVLFMSLEKEPTQVLRQQRRKFGFNVDRISTVGRDELYEVLKPGQVGGGLPFDVISDALQRLFTNKTKEWRGPTLVIVDSISVLSAMIREVQNPGARQLDVSSLREVFDLLCSFIWRNAPDTTLLFIGESKTDNRSWSSVAAESFFCDVEILLSIEVAAPKYFTRDEGESITAYTRTLDRLPFCQVVKSRYTRHQKRRCCYEIADGIGIHFHQTYPGKGTVRLFAENDAQNAVWMEFIERDLHDRYLYPGVECSIFSRGGLQRNFCSLRRFRHIPLYTDMYISSFDSYWINWARELGQRHSLAREMSTHLHCADVERGVWDSISSVDKSKIPSLYFRLIGKSHVAYQDYLMAKIPPELVLTEAYRSVCAGCALVGMGCTEDQFVTTVKGIIQQLCPKEADHSLFHVIDMKELRLFGEVRSRIIEELPQNNFTAAGDKLFAVPYDANISFCVLRKDLIASVLSQHETAGAITRRVSELKTLLAVAWRQAESKTPTSQAVPLSDNSLKDLRERLSHADEYWPRTWEEVIAFCEIAKKNCKMDLHVLIETLTCSSFTCAVLELIWNCGGELRVLADYSIPRRGEAERALFDAFYLLYYMFSNKIIPHNCTLEPDVFASRYPCEQKGSKPDWLLARHWYSTFIDVLTCRKNAGGKNYLWNPSPDSNMRLGIMPIPLSLDYYERQKTADPSGGSEPKHVSCWGEWYMGAFRGTENVALAIDLINNIMGSQKVCDRAFMRAGVPTVVDFYEMYGKTRCFNVPGRAREMLPSTTYTELRELLFPTAKSRSDIFDYHHSIRELHCIIEYVHTCDEITPAELLAKIRDALDRITMLDGKEMLLA